MRRKISSLATASGLPALKPTRYKMQFSSRSMLIGVCLVLYIILMFSILGVSNPECPTFEDLVLQDKNQPLVQSIKRIAKSVNTVSFGEDVDLKEINAPLAKLGIQLPIAVPPVAVALPAGKGEDVKPKPTAYAYELKPQNSLLKSTYVPNNVFYVWCGRRWFEFHHYISVMSAIREFRPDNIIFFYDVRPIMDSWTYNTWFDELREEYPFFRQWQLAPEDYACEGYGKVNKTFINNLLAYRGGIYIHENTILKQFPLLLRNHTLINALDPKTNQGFLLAQKGYPGKRSIDDILADPKLTTRTLQCTDVSLYIKSHRKPFCINTEKVFYPKDIWQLENSFGKTVRQIFYGSPEIPQPKKSYDDLIPNIAHIVWIGGGKMDFLFYLSVLSLIYVAEVDMVYIHGDLPPTGIYWDRIKDHEKLTSIYREVPGTVFGNKVDVLSHVTDVWRVDFMIKYGGIYVDTDAVFVKPLDREIRAYDAVGSYDWTYWNHPFPDTINFGVAIGKRNAKYWQKFQKSMSWFMDNDWSWNGLRQPYRIKERHPELVVIDPRLQVICFEAKCHPTWWPNYHDEQIHHLNSDSIINWRNDTYAFHWTLPTPDELLNEENLSKSDSIFGEIGKFILEKAGRL